MLRFPNSLSSQMRRRAAQAQGTLPCWECLSGDSFLTGTRACDLAQDGLEFETFLTPPRKCWDFRCGPPCLAQAFFCCMDFTFSYLWVCMCAHRCVPWCMWRSEKTLMKSALSFHPMGLPGTCDPPASPPTRRAYRCGSYTSIFKGAR